MKKEVVSIVKCSSYDNSDVAKAIQESLTNINFKFKDNLKVLLKPNILGPYKPNQNITTHPTIIEEICKILEKHNAKIFIGESSFNDTDLAFKVSGIKKIADKYGAKIINFEKQTKYKKEINHQKVQKIYFPKLLHQVDMIINLPKLKTHGLAKMTCAVKNLYGVISGQTKSVYHKMAPKAADFSELLLEINKEVKPELNIVDGIYGIEGEGPGTAGSSRRTAVILASTNPIALDFAAAKLIGYKPTKVYTNKIALKKKFFNGKYKLVGNAKNTYVNYKKPSSHMSSFLSAFYFMGKPKIEFNHEKCIRCGLCAKRCPVKAIALTPFPNCDHNKCIKCLCCIEGCPKNAISLKEPLIRRITKSIINFFRGVK